MWKDPIVEEIHLIRAKIAKECNYDLKQIIKRLREQEKKHREHVGPKKLRTKSQRTVG